MSPRKSRAEAASTHEAIVREAAEAASEIGLEGISIGSLASSLGMSKAGVAGHFRGKQELQMEVIELGARDFTEKIWVPNAKLKPGKERLLGCLDTWYAYSAGSPFRGGCLMTSISTEFDGRPGPVRETIAETWGRWTIVLRNDLDIAIEADELSPPLSPADTITAIESLATGVNQQTQLFHEKSPEKTASAAARVLLGIL
ncbi:MAG: TetR/AcrR family transcriptional regulator [Solirubrobacterales bacterium]|nr:TetR/AcrR family transcriptional regulator [Solirubrobacterales bacterium]MCB8916073.1 TetR/AcrR family transcriptional regulator [Thermoleophilales bacterium]